jgi:hypothetical protein
MFNPLNQKNYFSQYDLSILKIKILEHMSLEWEDLL